MYTKLLRRITNLLKGRPSVKKNYITASLSFNFVSRALKLILFGVYHLVEAFIRLGVLKFWPLNVHNILILSKEQKLGLRTVAFSICFPFVLQVNRKKITDV